MYDDNAAALVSESGPVDPLAGMVTTEPGKARVALGYLHAVNPDTGLEVVFTPGEALPEWAQDVQADRLRPSAAKPQQEATEPGSRAVRPAQRKTGPK